MIVLRSPRVANQPQRRPDGATALVASLRRPSAATAPSVLSRQNRRKPRSPASIESYAACFRKLRAVPQPSLYEIRLGCSDVAEHADAEHAREELQQRRIACDLYKPLLDRIVCAQLAAEEHFDCRS
jgi:hypothetical protein